MTIVPANPGFFLGLPVLNDADEIYQVQFIEIVAWRIEEDEPYPIAVDSWGDRNEWAIKTPSGLITIPMVSDFEDENALLAHWKLVQGIYRKRA